MKVLIFLFFASLQTSWAGSQLLDSCKSIVRKGLERVNIKDLSFKSQPLLYSAIEADCLALGDDHPLFLSGNTIAYIPKNERILKRESDCAGFALFLSRDFFNHNNKVDETCESVLLTYHPELHDIIRNARGNSESIKLHEISKNILECADEITSQIILTSNILHFFVHGCKSRICQTAVSHLGSPRSVNAQPHRHNGRLQTSRSIERGIHYLELFSVGDAVKVCTIEALKVRLNNTSSEEQVEAACVSSSLLTFDKIFLPDYSTLSFPDCLFNQSLLCREITNFVRDHSASDAFMDRVKALQSEEEKTSGSPTLFPRNYLSKNYSKSDNHFIQQIGDYCVGDFREKFVKNSTGIVDFDLLNEPDHVVTRVNHINNIHDEVNTIVLPESVRADGCLHMTTAFIKTLTTSNTSDTENTFSELKSAIQNGESACFQRIQGLRDEKVNETGNTTSLNKYVFFQEDDWKTKLTDYVIEIECHNGANAFSHFYLKDSSNRASEDFCHMVVGKDEKETQITPSQEPTTEISNMTTLVERTTPSQEPTTGISNMPTSTPIETTTPISPVDASPVLTSHNIRRFRGTPKYHTFTDEDIIRDILSY